MPIADLQSWADNLELVRLPLIESDVADALTGVSTLTIQLNQVSQDLGDQLAAHTVSIGANATDAGLANTRALDALSQIYDTGLDARTYTDNRIQYVLDELANAVSTINTYVNGSFLGSIQDLIDGVGPDLSTEIDAKLALAQAQQQAAADLYATWVNDVELQLNDILPNLTTLQESVLFDLAELDSTFSTFLTGFTDDTLVAGLDSLREENEANIAPLGGSILRLPRSQWTTGSDGATVALVKPKLNSYGTFVTNDADFGECFEFPDGANKTIGLAYPIEFDPSRFYRIQVRMKVVDDGSFLQGVNYRVGVTTQKGDTLVQANIQTSGGNLKVADGILTFNAYVGTDATPLDKYGITTNVNRIILTGSAAANKIYPFVRQNYSGGVATNGILRVASIYITDITDVLTGLQVIRNEITAGTGEVGAHLASTFYTKATTYDAGGGSVLTLDAYVASNRGIINDILALDVTEDHALGTFLTEMGVDVDGNVAGVASFGTVMADVYGKSQSLYGIRSVAGGSGAEFQVVAWDDEDGTGGSAIVLSADNIIAKGTMSTDTLIVGSARNLMEDPRFTQGARGWNTANGTGTVRTQTAVSLNPAGSAYAGSSDPTVMLHQTGTATDGHFQLRFSKALPDDTFTNKYIPCKPGDWLEFSAQAATIQSRFTLGLFFYDITGTQIGFYPVASDEEAPGADGSNPELWDRFGGKVQAPALAAFAVPAVRKFGTLLGSASTVYLYKPQVCDTHEFAQQLSPFGDGKVTLIDGNKIITGTLWAEAVNTASFAAAGLALFGGTVQSTTFDELDPNIQGWQLKNDGTATFHKIIAKEAIIDGEIVTEALSDNAVSTIRSSSGTGNQSVSWTLPDDASISVMAFFDLHISAAGSFTCYARIYRDATLLAEAPLTNVDASPSVSSAQSYVTLVAKDTRVAGQTPTYWAKLEAGATATRSVSILVIETRK